MQKALSKKSQNKPAQKKVAQKKVTQRHSGKKREDVIILKNVWKIFGLAAEEAMQAVQERGLGKAEILSEFGCVVGLADCSFAVKRGEVFCIMGLSGSGKSTLVRHINRLIEPTSRSIEVLGADICALENEALRQMRSLHIGMVFQHMALLPHRTVRDNVAFPLQVRATANILAVAIEENLGLEVELQTSTNPVIFEAMDKGNMHVHPEV